MNREHQPHIIVTGNVVDGFEFYGPFETEAAAVYHANNDGNLPDDWCIAPLYSVED